MFSSGNLIMEKRAKKVFMKTSNRCQLSTQDQQVIKKHALGIRSDSCMC